uniref:Uncharacterized protein n=1 Tax=Thermorudis sp. TaxID=1969470 RepID=A0A7C2WHM4_9BACT
MCHYNHAVRSCGSRAPREHDASPDIDLRVLEAAEPTCPPHVIEIDRRQPEAVVERPERPARQEAAQLL